VSRRLWINAAAFLTLFAILSLWAVRNVLHLDAIDRPRGIVAEFDTSPGLRAGFEVTYFGVHAGSLGKVSIQGDHVVAHLKIDRDLELPAELDAAVRRKSAVGEPYVDLVPTGGTDPGGPRLQAGAVIPRQRTTTPLSYAEVFQAVDDLVTGLPADDLHTLLHSMAAGFQGRADDLRSALVGADRLTTDLVANAPLLDSLADDLTTLTHTITEHRDSLGAGWDHLATLTQTLADQTDHITHLLDRGPVLTDQVNALLASSGPDIGCIVDSAASVAESLDDPVKISQFERLLDLSGPAADIIKTIAYEGPDGLYLNGVFVFDVAHTADVRYYDPPLTMPKAPPLRTCQAARVVGPVGPGGTASTGDTHTAPPTTKVAVPHRVLPTSTVPASSRQHIPGSRDIVDLLPWLLGAAVLAGLAVVARRRWPRTAPGDTPLSGDDTQ
jgi:phospholipid/cholesterol/gamma-HCH transport system substrate-binding protein